MAITMRENRRSGKRQDPTGPSVREVCLLGVSRPLTEGERVTWSGRAYRVETARAGYAHLAPASE